MLKRKKNVTQLHVKKKKMQVIFLSLSSINFFFSVYSVDKNTCLLPY